MEEISDIVETAPICDKPEIKKKKVFTRRFNEKWKLDPTLRHWISEPRDVKGTAHCLVCRIDIAGSSALLKRHAKTTKHINRVKEQGLQWMLDEQDQEDKYPTYEAREEHHNSTEPDEEYSQQCQTKPYHRKKCNKVRLRRPSQNYPEHEYIDPRNYCKPCCGDQNDGSAVRVIYKEIYVDKSKSQFDDHLSSFGKYIGDELRRIDNFYSIQTAKCKISNILFDATVGKFSKVHQAVDFSHDNQEHSTEIMQQHNHQSHDSPSPADMPVVE